jgi:hypothetical protein
MVNYCPARILLNHLRPQKDIGRRWYAANEKFELPMISQAAWYSHWSHELATKLEAPRATVITATKTSAKAAHTSSCALCSRYLLHMTSLSRSGPLEITEYI